MAIVLTITDNGDGTGGVANFTGSDPASMNVLYQAAFAGIQQNLNWLAAGVHVGDGMIAFNPGSGQYFWYLASTITPFTSQIVFQSLSNASIEAVHYRMLLSAQSRIQGLGLSGIPSGQVQLKYTPRWWENIDTTPAIVVTPFGKESQPGGLNARDDIGYPISVAVVDKANQDYTTNLARDLLWRQQIFRALRNQRLPGVLESINNVAVTDWICNPEIFQKNLFYSEITFMCISREIRGI